METRSLYDRGLTIKQRRFIKNFIDNGGNASKAALDAGYAYRQSGDENLSNPVINNAIRTFAQKEGLTDNQLVGTLKEGLNADISVSSQGETRCTRHPDHLTRLSYVELLLKLRGLIKT